MKYQDGTFYSQVERLVYPLVICVLYLGSCAMALPSTIIVLIILLGHLSISTTSVFLCMVTVQFLYIVIFSVFGRGGFVTDFISVLGFFLNFGVAITIGNIILLFAGDDSASNPQLMVSCAAAMYIIQAIVVVYHSTDNELRANFVETFA